MERAELRIACPVAPYERAAEGYAESVLEWLSDPHAYFRSFGREAREFQQCHRSERLRTMTLVAPAAELEPLRPVCVCLDGATEPADSWEVLFAAVTARLVPAFSRTFAALQTAGELDWLGCPAEGRPVADMLAAGTLCPGFASRVEIVARVQWLFLMCGIRLNEVIVQVDPYSDEEWDVRREELRRKRADEQSFMRGRRAAQKAWAEAHLEETGREF